MEEALAAMPTSEIAQELLEEVETPADAYVLELVRRIDQWSSAFNDSQGEIQHLRKTHESSIAAHRRQLDRQRERINMWRRAAMANAAALTTLDGYVDTVDD